MRETALSIAIPLTSCIIVAVILRLSVAYGGRPATQNSKLQKKLESWRPYGRSVVYGAAVVWACALFVRVALGYQETGAALSELMRDFGLTALVLLFAVFVPGIVSTYFTNAPGMGLLIHLRRALGVSAFCFALTHAGIGFFHNLGATANALTYVSGRHQLALVLAAAALTILFMLAITSFDRAWEWGGRRLKQLHRLVYAAALLALMHVLLIGSDFTKLTHWLPMAVLCVALCILLLEIIGTIMALKRKNRLIRPAWKLFAGVLVLIAIAAPIIVNRLLVSSAYDPHAVHLTGTNVNTKYSVAFTTVPAKPVAGQPFTATLTVRNSQTKALVEDFRTYQEKLMHAVLVSSDLTGFQHLHPEYKGGGVFELEATVPLAGNYHMYVEYAPASEPATTEQVSAVTFTTAGAPAARVPNLTPKTRSEVDGRFVVDVPLNQPLTSGVPVVLSFAIRDGMFGGTGASLQPYLGAFGHLAVISENRRTYTHVHPLVPAAPDTLGGPKIAFTTTFPTAGRYKMFLQFTVEGRLHVADFVVEVTP